MLECLSGLCQVEFAYRLSEKDIKGLNDIIAFNKSNYTVQRRDKISELFPVHMFASFDRWQPERMRMPAPAEVKAALSEQAAVHSTLQSSKVQLRRESFAVSLC